VLLGRVSVHTSFGVMVVLSLSVSNFTHTVTHINVNVMVILILFHLRIQEANDTLQMTRLTNPKYYYVAYSLITSDAEMRLNMYNKICVNIALVIYNLYDWNHESTLLSSIL